MVDGLTGVANRRRFDEAIDKEWRQFKREETPLSLLMIDIDRFKAINDTYGHQSGDDVLRLVACALSRNLSRSGDLLARYGGEEFAALLPKTELSAALQVAERLRQAVADAFAAPGDLNLPKGVTVSIGCAATAPNGMADMDSLVRMADNCLYRAKQNGRNRVEGK